MILVQEIFSSSPALSIRWTCRASGCNRIRSICYIAGIVCPPRRTNVWTTAGRLEDLTNANNIIELCHVRHKSTVQRNTKTCQWGNDDHLRVARSQREKRDVACPSHVTASLQIANHMSVCKWSRRMEQQEICISMLPNPSHESFIMQHPRQSVTKKVSCRMFHVRILKEVHTSWRERSKEFHAVTAWRRLHSTTADCASELRVAPPRVLSSQNWE